MPRLYDCDRQLNAIITTEDDYLSGSTSNEFLDLWGRLFFDYVEEYNLTLSNTPHSHNTSYAWEITDHVSRNKDILTLSGTLNCNKGCVGGSNSNYFNLEEQVKRFKERMLHKQKDFAVIVMSTGFIFRRAILTNATINVSNNKVQEKTVSMTFHGHNLSGSVYKPDYRLGGVYSSGLGLGVF